MTRADILSKWAGSVSFAVISTPRRLRLSSYEKGEGNLGTVPWDYIEIDNLGNGRTLYVGFNGRTASSVVDATFVTGLNAIATVGADAKQPNIRVYPYTVEQLYIRATGISVVSAGTGTTIFLRVARF